MKKSKLLAILLSICLLVPLLSGFTLEGEIAGEAVTDAPQVIEPQAREMTDLEKIAAGLATVEEIFGRIEESTVPEIVGYEKAVSKNHIERLYTQEGNDLNRLVFRNIDDSVTEYIFDHPVKYIDSNGKTQDISPEIKQGAELGQFETASGAAITTFSQKAREGITLSGNGVKVSLVPVVASAASESSSAAANGIMQVSSSATAKLKNSKTVSYTLDSKTELEYSLTYTGFKEDIVVKAKGIEPDSLSPVF